MKSETTDRDCRKTALIVGASSGVGRALVRSLAADGHDCILLARDEEELSRVAQDAVSRSAVETYILKADLASSEFDPGVVIGACRRFHGSELRVFFVAGIVDDSDVGPGRAEIVEPTVGANFAGPVKLACALIENRGELRLQNIAFVSSIAAAVPRGRNAIYAAAKAGLESYALSLRHALAAEGMKIQIYRLGYVDTALTYGQKLLFPRCSVSDVANFIVRGIGRDLGIVYYPRFWRLVVGLLKALPWQIYKRISF